MSADAPHSRAWNSSLSAVSFTHKHADQDPPVHSLTRKGLVTASRGGAAGPARVVGTAQRDQS